MARADFAASVKSYSRPLFYRTLVVCVCACVLVRIDTKERLRVCETRRIVCTTIRGTTTYVLSRAWAVDFSKRIITKSQLRLGPRPSVMEPFVENRVETLLSVKRTPKYVNRGAADPEPAAPRNASRNTRTRERVRFQTMIPRRSSLLDRPRLFGDRR